MNASLWLTLICCFLQMFCSGAQDYGGLARGAGLVRRRNNRAVIFTALTSGVVGGIAGGWITSKRLSKKYEVDKRELLHFMQLQDEVYQQREKQYEQELKKLYKIVEELEQDALKRDYEEFKAPDADHDDLISRSEFNTYVEKYLKSFPELSEQDFPKFEEFDADENGKVSFPEWQQFLIDQKLSDNKVSHEQYDQSNVLVHDGRRYNHRDQHSDTKVLKSGRKVGVGREK